MSAYNILPDNIRRHVVKGGMRNVMEYGTTKLKESMMMICIQLLHFVYSSLERETFWEMKDLPISVKYHRYIADAWSKDQKITNY